MDGMKIKKYLVLSVIGFAIGFTYGKCQAGTLEEQDCVRVKGIATDLLNLKTKYKLGREEMYRGLTGRMLPGPETREVKKMYRGLIDKIYDDYTPEEIEGECNGQR